MTLLNNGLRSNSLHQNAQDWRRKPTIYGPKSSAPVYATGAVSLDLGATWSYNQQPPSWIIANPAPSGDLALRAANWKVGAFWVQGVTSGLESTPMFIEDNVDWGHYDPTTDVVLGSGLGSPISGTPVDRGEPVLNAPYCVAVVAGFTLLTVMNTPALNSGGDTIDFHVGPEWADYPNYDTDYFQSFIVNYGALTDLGSAIISGDGGTSHSTIPFVTTNGIHKTALLFDETQAVISVDGNANIIAPAVVYTPLTPPTTIALQAGNQQSNDAPATQRSFVEMHLIYAPQPVGDLPTMSAP